MRGLIVVASALLMGCPAAIIVGGLTHENAGHAHPPNSKDYESWVGAPKPQLETHRQFGALPRQVKRISDGSEMWLFRTCPADPTGDPEKCCMHQFVIASDVVTSYRMTGRCLVDCRVWPEAKVQGCINDTAVPDGYGRSRN